MRKRHASDDELMLAAAGGDAGAFDALMQRHRDWVRWLLRAFVHDVETAEDLTQETFCRVYQHLGRYMPQGNFVAWLKRVAVNSARDFLRRQRVQGVMPLEEREETFLADVRQEPLCALAAGQLQEELRAAIEQLPDEQRLPLIMHYLGDMSLPDIAWAMRCPVGTVKSRLFYGLRRVRQTLTTEWLLEGEKTTP